MKSFNIKYRQYYIHVGMISCPKYQVITNRRGRFVYVQNFNSPVCFFFSNTYVTMSDVVFKQQKCWFPITIYRYIIFKVVTHQKAFFQKSFSKETYKNRTCSNCKSLLLKTKNCESFHDTRARFLSKVTGKMRMCGRTDLQILERVRVKIT